MSQPESVSEQSKHTTHASTDAPGDADHSAGTVAQCDPKAGESIDVPSEYSGHKSRRSQIKRARAPRAPKLIASQTSPPATSVQIPSEPPITETEIETEIVSHVPSVPPAQATALRRTQAAWHGFPGSSSTGVHVEQNPSAEITITEPYHGASPLPPWIHAREPVTYDSPSADLVMLHTPQSPAARQFRAMRYRLEQDPEAQIVTVISPRADDGKSVTAANLALALAEGGRVKVLLIDAALHSPGQATLFGLKCDAGLTSAIAARSGPPQTPVSVVRISNGLFVLPAGPRVLSPHGALASEAAAHLLGALRRTFRYIIVDSSPVFGSAETLAWHGMIDRYVLVARRGKTTTEDLGRASDRLGREKILGVTLTGVRQKSLGG